MMQHTEGGISSDDEVLVDDDETTFFRIPSSSSSFFALATLAMPSPSPSFSSSFSMDFNDLPFMVVSSVSQSSPEASPTSPQEENGPSYLVESNSGCESLCSLGTFGPRYTPGGAMRGQCMTISDDNWNCVDRPDCDADDVPLSAFQAAVYDPDDVSLAHPEPTEAQEVVLAYMASHPSELAGKLCQSLSGNLMPQPKPRHRIPVVQIHPYSGSGDAQRYGPTPIPPPELQSSGLRAGTECMAMGSPSFDKPDRTRNKIHRGLQRARREPKPEFIWLHGISVDLLIDQEGFRSATPSFRYSGVNRSKHDETTCTVTFRAAAKHGGFNFHYNPFDSLPILRRVTIHGEESKDFISKQAHLALKTNGIYSVHGAEVSSLSPLPPRLFNPLGQAHEPEKLDWEFRYLVEDRIDAHGQVVDGEKKLVPLTFTCSPWLLHPSQGKRVNLMHMFRKGVSMKLTAEMTKSCDDVMSLPQVIVSGDNPVDGDGLGSGNAPVGAKLHRRARSHAVRDGIDTLGGQKTPASSGSGRDTKPSPGIGNSAGGNFASSKSIAKYRPLKRRASSVGEGSWISM